MKTTETIKALAMSGSTFGMTMSECEAELAEMRAIVADHRARLDAAAEAFDAACGFCLPTANGFYTVWTDRFYLYPAVDAAHRAYQALKDDDLGYWAQARATDIERRVGAGWSTQTTLGIAA